MINLYRQTKTLISFWYRRRLTLRSLIQPSETLTIELTVWCKVIFSTTLSSAVRPIPSLYRTSIFWSNMQFSAVYKVWQVGFGLIYFSKFWAGLAKSKIDFFFFVLGQILNCWTSYLFIYFGLAYPNQHMLGKFGPAQSFVFFSLARKWCLLLIHDMTVWHRVIDYIVSNSVASKTKQVLQIPIARPKKKMIDWQ